jgi:hypothetical protein
VLKKVGIVATAATAALIALSPFAFATGGPDDGDTTTTVTVEDNSVERDQVNRCTFEQGVADGGLVPGVLPTQIQALNCINIGDGSSFGLVPAPALP